MRHWLQETSRQFWVDETGAVVSAELALVAALGVAGAAVGLDTFTKSVNDELTDVAFAIRSLDQSFTLKPLESAGSTVAGSRFKQMDVSAAHEELRTQKAKAETRQQERMQKLKQERVQEDDDSFARGSSPMK